MKGVKIYVSYAEYEAIHDAIDEIENNIEGADEEYVEGALVYLEHLRKLVIKFKKANK